MDVQSNDRDREDGLWNGSGLAAGIQARNAYPLYLAHCYCITCLVENGDENHVHIYTVSEDFRW